MRMMGKGSLASVVTTLVTFGCYLTLALLGLSICLLAVAPLVNSPGVAVGLVLPTAMSLDSETHAVNAAPSNVVNVHLQDLRGTLAFSPRSSVAVAGVAVVAVAILALILWILMQLRLVLRTLKAGQPFVAANATRIRRIGYAIVFGELARAALTLAGMHYAMTRFSIEGVRFEAKTEINLVVIVCGLIVLVISEVFREGTRLIEEQSLTV